jgi:purine-nucleoside phosphorylase
LTPEIMLARPHHVSEMAAIERRCFPCPWSESQLDKCIRISARSRTWIALAGGAIAGYICALASELDLLHVANLAVLPRYRNQGLGSILMKVAEQWGARVGMHASYLEVRKENTLAINLYRKIGYCVQTNLNDFYGRGEDGLRCVKELRPDPSRSISAALRNTLGSIPGTGVILGSGLSWVAGLFGESRSISCSGLPGHEGQLVPGHPGRISISECGRFVFLQGRRHRYEGFDGDAITALPGAISDLGTHTWVLTTSSGAVDASFEVGDAMIFRDHVNLSCCTPSGHLGSTGQGVYSDDFMRLALDVAESAGCRVHSGVFACVAGPSYETPAELALLRSRGISAVSMSTAQEALLLSGRGCRVLGLSTITNTVEAETAVTHEDVLAAQSVVREKQEPFIRQLLEKAAGHGLR